MASLLACSAKPFRSKGILAASISSTCPAVKSQFFSQEKVQFSVNTGSASFEDFNLKNLSENFSGKSVNPSALAAENSRSLSVVLSHSCHDEKSKRHPNFAAQFIREPIKKVGQSDLNSYLVVAQNSELKTLADIANQDPCIVGISENFPIELSYTPNDAKLSQQKQLTAINAQEAWDIFYAPQTGIQKEIVIAVIDSGIDMNHEEFKDILWVNNKEVPGNGLDDDGNGLVDDVNGYNFADNIASPAHSGEWNGWYHGTHVAGLAAAKMNNSVGVSGVMGRNVKIMALNVFGNTAIANPTNIEKALRYAADQGAHIVNMSLGGGGRSESMGLALEYAVKKGTTVVAAAGNDNVDIAQVFISPASFAKDINGVISVGSTDAVTKTKSSFSNFNPAMVEIGAPGSNGLFSTMPNNTYNLLQGTSMASPVVAGAAGLVHSFIWTRTGTLPKPSDVESLLGNASDTFDNLKNFFKEGRHLNLFKVAQTIDRLYPATAGGSGSANGGNSSNTNCQ